jgi:hypothetical protein
MQEGKCGTVFGINIPSLVNIKANNLTNLLSQNKTVHWQIQKSKDFFCFRHHIFDAYLTLDGDDCVNLNEHKRCGIVNLHKVRDMKCIRDFGWRITMVQNFYILQSIKYPNVYLFLSGERCQQQLHRPLNVQPSQPARNISNIHRPEIRENVRNIVGNVARCGNVWGFYLENNQNLQSSNVHHLALFNLRQIQGM